MTDFREMAATARRASEARLDKSPAVAAIGADPDIALERLKAIALPLLEEAKEGFGAEGVPSTIRIHAGGIGGRAGPAIEFFCGLRRVRLRSTGATADVKGASLFLTAEGEEIQAWMAATRASAGLGERLDGDLTAAVRTGAERSLATYFGEWEGLTDYYGIVF